MDFEKILIPWYTRKGVPCLHFKDVELFMIAGSADKKLLTQIGSGEYPRLHLRFKVFNSSNVDGVFSVNLEGDHSKGLKRYFAVPANTCMEFRINQDGFPYTYNYKINYCTYISQNNPQDYQSVIRFREPYSSRIFLSEVTDTSQRINVVLSDCFVDLKNEMIVDNDSPGFQLIDPPIPKLRSWLQGEEKQIGGYESAIANQFPWASNLISLRRYWTKAYLPYAYGDVQRTYYFIHANNKQAFAIWNIQLEEAGKYEVFVYRVKNQSKRFMGKEGTSFRWKTESALQYYTLHVGEQEHELSLLFGTTTNGWESLGIFDFPIGMSKLVLRARGDYEGQVIYADAVKWVKAK